VHWYNIETPNFSACILSSSRPYTCVVMYLALSVALAASISVCLGPFPAASKRESLPIALAPVATPAEKKTLSVHAPMSVARPRVPPQRMLPKTPTLNPWHPLNTVWVWLFCRHRLAVSLFVSCYFPNARSNFHCVWV